MINKKLDKSRYSVVDCKQLTAKEIKDKDYVLSPYICVDHNEETLSRYDKFMTEYNENHKYCPKCGATEYTSTLSGYILNWDKKEDYKDMNICKCMKCVYKHTTHDRVSSL